MLGQLVNGLPIALEISSARLLTSELVSHVKTQGYSVVCLADLPPSPPSRTRFLVKKLREALPELRIIVGRWASPDLADETAQPLIAAGASHVAASLVETRKYLAEAALVAAPEIPAAVRHGRSRAASLTALAGCVRLKRQPQMFTG